MSLNVFYEVIKRGVLYFQVIFVSTDEEVIGGVPKKSTIPQEHLAETAATLTTEHPHYATLAGRIEVDRIHKLTAKSFSDVMDSLYDPGRARSLHVGFMRHVHANASRLDGAIVHGRDFDLDYFGVRTLCKSYLSTQNGRIIERPQHMFMRVALAIHNGDIEKTIETYDLMSKRVFIHASPTLFNAGFRNGQLASCFLLPLDCSSVGSTYNTIRTCALITSGAGGIGLSVHNASASGTYDDNTGVTSSGIVPLMRVFNESIRHVDQGTNKRPGAMTIYLEPWHLDIMAFLDLRKNHGNVELRARALFYALWMPDIFMRRVEADEMWTLFCPSSVPLLSQTYGEEFETHYNTYELSNVRKKALPARDIWARIVQCQVETGMPFILYKDAANRKSNHKHLGTLTSSNLCTEIMQHASHEETAVCNLASIALPHFVLSDGNFDYTNLHKVTKVVVRNLNNVIDIGSYPTAEARLSSHNHRAIGVGVQGLFDTFARMELPVESTAAATLNANIFETIYHGALEASCELAAESGTYTSWQDSPTASGVLQPDMWGVQPSNLWNWDTLRMNIANHGLRNSLLTAVMPTASTSQIFGLSEGIEIPISNMYTRRVISGDFQVVSPALVSALSTRGLWNASIKQQLFEERGSIQCIDEIPIEIRNIFKTAWEISQKTVIDLAAARAPFICQSQSMSIHIASPTMESMSSMHFHAWKSGLKTGMYYLRTQPAAFPIAFTVEGHEVVQLLAFRPYDPPVR
ncbi:ribonucleotide reductase [Hygrophoropsis aurantiaca]|uniref:Ribonucleotide reductase n=1 Tax=Hygrophoropsis aurantiaca TaxID=72124 RepID=A0ACB8A9Z3_9AGAM|nr:ribonucleotide reductase [Hygrophoropsis aurantiaca]